MVSDFLVWTIQWSSWVLQKGVVRWFLFLLCFSAAQGGCGEGMGRASPWLWEQSVSWLLVMKKSREISFRAELGNPSLCFPAKFLCRTLLWFCLPEFPSCLWICNSFYSVQNPKFGFFSFQKQCFYLLGVFNAFLFGESESIHLVFFFFLVMNKLCWLSLSLWKILTTYQTQSTLLLWLQFDFLRSYNPHRLLSNPNEVSWASSDSHFLWLSCHGTETAGK